MRSKTFRKYIALILTLVTVFSTLSMAQPVSAATSTTYDFNGVDFDTSLRTNNLGSGVSTTASAPAGYTDSVMSGKGATYVSVGVDFPMPIDTSKIISVKVKMYVKEYTLSGTPYLRVISTGESTGNNLPYFSKQFVGELGGTFNDWVELDITEGLNVVTKDQNGYLDRFVIGYRVYGAEEATVYYDSITIVHENGLFVGQGDASIDVYDFNGEDFETPSDTNKYVNASEYFAKKLNAGDSAPAGYQDSVYAVKNGVYCASWIKFNGKLDLSKITSIKARIYIESYTATGSANFRVFGKGDATYVSQNHNGPYDQWFELDLLNILKDSQVIKNGDGTIDKFLLSFRTYGTTTIYFDSIIIEGENYFTPFTAFETAIKNVKEDISGQAPGTTPSWFVYFDHSAIETLPGTAWETQWENVKVLINNKEHNLILKNSGGNCMFTEIGYSILSTDTSFAKIDIIAGNYVSNDGTANLQLTSDFTFYIYDGDVWNNASSVDYTVEITFERIDAASQVLGGKWDMYPAPYNAAQTPGTPWQSRWLNVSYEIDGVTYTGELERAADEQGLYLMVPNTHLSPTADGAVVTIKAGTYAAKVNGDPSIRVTKDFTFYVIKGTPVTEFDFDAPEFTETVYNCVDQESYTVTDADTVTIDGETYKRGDTFAEIGTHTLTYVAYNREYTRKLVIWSVGEVNDNEEIDARDIIRFKRYQAGQVTLTESAMLGADMNCDSTINEEDLALIRRMMVLMEGFLVLYPQYGAEALLPSEQVATLENAYDLTANATDAMKNGTALYHRKPLTLKWVSPEKTAEYNVHVATKEDFSDELVHKATGTQYTLSNLLPATTYYWKLSVGNVESEVFSFVTADTARTLTIDGVDNTRDIGGYDALGGTTMKYGMVYRMGTLDDITQEGKYQMLTVLGVKTDLDVRTPGEGTAGTGSPLGANVNYFNYNAPYYWNKLIASEYREALLGEIRVFANQENYPIAIHCSVGRDRTGTVLFLIEGLCGMSKSDLFFEYELSILSSIGGATNANVQDLMGNMEIMYTNIQAYAPNGTFAEACEAFMLNIGITQEEIDSIKDILTD